MRANRATNSTRGRYATAPPPNELVCIPESIRILFSHPGHLSCEICMFKAKFHYASYSLELVGSWFEAKFHYAIWIEPASNQLRTTSEPASNQLRTGSEPDSVMEFGREPASSRKFAASKLDDRPNFSSNQLRTGSEPAPNRYGASSEPASVIEFGFGLVCFAFFRQHSAR